MQKPPPERKRIADGTSILFRMFDDGWLQGTISGRSERSGSNYVVQFSTDDGPCHVSLDHSRYESKGAKVAAGRWDVWCILTQID
jgi:hypothetical protein